MRKGTGKRAVVLAAFAAILCGTACSAEKSEADLMRERDRMMDRDIAARGVSDRAVLQAMRSVPRHDFVLPEFRDMAYADRPLPIGSDQTISQPYIVAAMTELVKPDPDDVMLEVGTGSGYQAAVLAQIVSHVYTIEIVPELGKSAERKLQELEIDNVTVRVGDGYAGWPEHAPFDGIIVTCGAEKIPAPLVEQLRPGGVMVIPVGPFHEVQELTVIEKKDDGSIIRRSVMPVRFVPMTGEGYGGR